MLLYLYTFLIGPGVLRMSDTPSNDVRELIRILSAVHTKVMNAPVLNGGFDNLNAKVDKLEEKVDDIHEAVYEPDEGLFARIKTIDSEHSNNLHDANQKISKLEADIAKLEVFRNDMNSLKLVIRFTKWAFATIFGVLLIAATKFSIQLLSEHVSLK